RTAAAGDLVFGPGVADQFRTLFTAATRPRAASAFPTLTDRELGLLELIAQGLDNPVIGRRLGLAAKTVRNQVSLLLTKMSVPDRAAAVVVARNAGLGRVSRS